MRCHYLPNVEYGSQVQRNLYSRLPSIDASKGLRKRHEGARRGAIRLVDWQNAAPHLSSHDLRLNYLSRSCKQPKGMVFVLSSLTTRRPLSSLSTTSTLVTLPKLLSNRLDLSTGYFRFIAIMENQQRSHVPRIELNHQQLSDRPQDEQFEHQFTASVNDSPGMGDP
jgi:hypothetical protein